MVLVDSAEFEEGWGVTCQCWTAGGAELVTALGKQHTEWCKHQASITLHRWAGCKQAWYGRLGQLS